VVAEVEVLEVEEVLGVLVLLDVLVDELEDDVLLLVDEVLGVEAVDAVCWRQSRAAS
jgi:hypothetical protein